MTHSEVILLNDRGLQLHSAGDRKGAMDLFSRALMLDDHCAEVHNNIGVAYWQAGEAVRAMKHFSAALKIDPAYRDAVLNLGDVFLVQGEVGKAAVVFDHYLKSHPEDSSIAEKRRHLKTDDRETIPFSQADWSNTPQAVRNYVEKTISENRQEAGRKQKLIGHLKQHYFPGSTFVGPYEEAGVVHGVLTEQWLWQHRHLVRGDVMDMSTPRHWHHFLNDLPAVNRWLISDLNEQEVCKMGHSSPVDIIGDFCASPAPVPAQSLDTILCISILEHCKDPFAMMRNLADILRPQGTLFLQMPFAYIDGHLAPDYWRFCHDGYLLLAEQARLEVIAIGEYGDLGKYFLMDWGFSAEAASWHRGVPLLNWMICTKR